MQLHSQQTDIEGAIRELVFANFIAPRYEIRAELRRSMMAMIDAQIADLTAKIDKRGRHHKRTKVLRHERVEWTRRKIELECAA